MQLDQVQQTAIMHCPPIHAYVQLIHDKSHASVQSIIWRHLPSVQSYSISSMQRLVGSALLLLLHSRSHFARRKWGALVQLYSGLSAMPSSLVRRSKGLSHPAPASHRRLTPPGVRQPPVCRVQHRKHTRRLGTLLHLTRPRQQHSLTRQLRCHCRKYEGSIESLNHPCTRKVQRPGPLLRLT
jgi:hypothetical protein